MKSSFCIDLQRFMLIPTKFPLTQKVGFFYPKTITSRNFIAIHDIFFELVLRHRFNSLNKAWIMYTSNL